MAGIFSGVVILITVSREHAPILVLTIDRPARRNALGDETVKALRRTLKDAESDESVRATIITGSAPGFCAGSDLKELAQMNLAAMCEHEADTALVAREIAQLRKPVIAAVEGFALGGGFYFAASCDLVVSSRSCRWHLPEVRNGWIPPWGLEALVARVGVVTARRLTWGGEECDGVEAHRIGLADYLAADGDSLAAALVIAARLAQLPGEAVSATKLYFAAQATHFGEAGDATANRMFGDNCRHPAAAATLERFGVKL